MPWQKLHDNQFTIDPTGEKKVILSIDGGGMRGTIAIAMLAELEKQTGQACQVIFDMIAGTSTGTLIAVGLALGMPAQQILQEIYLDKLPRAFQAKQVGVLARLGGWLAGHLLSVDENLAARLLSNGLHYAYSLDPFLESLKSLGQGKYLRDLTYPNSCILFATTKDVQTGETNFLVSAGKGKEKFADWPLTGVVAASGAAPIYFPPVLNRYVDGGVGVYANPCLGASVEAMEYIAPEIPDFRDGNVIHVSLGTGYVEDALKSGAAQDYTFFNWLEYVALEGLDDAALQQVFSTRAIYGATGRMDFRRYNPLLNGKNISDALQIELVGKPDPALLSLDSSQPEQVAFMVEIGQEYAKRIDWSKPGLMPWDTVGGQRDPRVVADSQPPPTWENTPYAK